MLRKCCSLPVEMNRGQMNDLSGFYFLLRKKQKSTFVLRITNSSSDTNLDEGSVYEGVHFVHAQARDGKHTHLCVSQENLDPLH